MATQHQVDNRHLKQLRNGDHMRRSDFHRLYCDMPEGYRAELIAGMVFEPSPVSYAHGEYHATLSYLLKVYAKATPGLGLADNATVMLSDDDEPQPDLVLRIASQRTGRSGIEGKYIKGAPELVAEIAYSSRAIDLHLKKERYASFAVQEYIVVCLEPKEFYWFDLQKSVRFTPDSAGILKSSVFPGLWIHGKGLLDLDEQLTDAALAQGLKSAAHKRFLKV